MKKDKQLVIYVSKIHLRGNVYFTVRSNQDDVDGDYTILIHENLDNETARLADWFKHVVKMFEVDEYKIIFNQEFRISGSKMGATLSEPLTEREIRLFFSAVGGGFCNSYSGE